MIATAAVFFVVFFHTFNLFVDMSRKNWVLDDQDVDLLRHSSH